MRLRDAIDIHCTFGGGGGDSASSTMPLHGHPETPFNRAKQRKGGEDKGGVQSAAKKKRKKNLKRSSVKGTSGGQSDGSSLISRNYKVVDGLGRKLHEFKTKEEAEQASAGNRYTKVWRTTIPDEDTPEVRDMIRKRPGDTQVRTFRRSLPFPNTPFPQGPTGR
jgi:hypothetical protein